METKVNFNEGLAETIEWMKTINKKFILIFIEFNMNSYLINYKKNIRDCLIKLEKKNSHKCLVVIDDLKQLKGTVTDGDIKSISKKSKPQCKNN